MGQLQAERLFVNRLQETRPQGTVDGDGGPNRLVSEGIQFAAWFGEGTIHSNSSSSPSRSCIDLALNSPSAKRAALPRGLKARGCLSDSTWGRIVGAVASAPPPPAADSCTPGPRRPRRQSGQQKG